MDNWYGWKLFGRYLWDHMRLLTACVTCVGIFVLVLYLSDVSFGIYGYAFLVAGAVGLTFGIYDYWKYWKSHFELRNMEKSITADCSAFPIPRNRIEQDYQALCSKLHKSMTELYEGNELRHKDMVDYYTLWAHQIKTPITAMRLLIQVEDNDQNTVLQQQLLKIERYVEMVLQYLRVEHMSADLKLQQYQILTLVRKAVKQDSSVFIYRKLPLELQEMEDTVLTDEKWMVFVIEQILSNALKYTNEGHIAIYMDKERKKTLVIEDTGIGIREEDLPRIFENGFTGYNGRMERRATGIGLYLCKQILDKLGHEIQVNSVVGRGTQIRIDLYRDKLDTE